MLTLYEYDTARTSRYFLDEAEKKGKKEDLNYGREVYISKSELIPPWGI